MHSLIKSVRGIGICALMGMALVPQARGDTANIGAALVESDSFSDMAIDRATAPDDSRSLFLADDQHIGTVQPDLLANAFASDLNSNLNTDAAPIVAQVDAIRSIRSVPVAVPLPRTWEMGTLGLLIVAAAGSKLGKRILN